MLEALDSRAAEYFEGDPTQTALDYVCCWIEGGQTINDLADELSKSLGYTIHREWIGIGLRKQFGEDEATARLANARAHASHTLAEAAIGLSDAPAETSVDVARNGLRARSRQWTAERWNRAQYGNQQQTNVSISLHSLHLTALQAVNREVTGSPQLPAIASPSTSEQ